MAVSGKLNNNSWEDAEGNKRYSVDVVVNEIMVF